MSCHTMCDLCGVRQCDRRSVVTIRNYGHVNACDSCVRVAVKHSYNAACAWGGTVIDLEKPCGVVTRRSLPGRSDSERT
jgi:hypothetical protein